MMFDRFKFSPVPRLILAAFGLFLAGAGVAAPNAAFAQPGIITIIKHAAPNDPQDFTFNSNASAIGTFQLDDDNTPQLPNNRSFNLPPPPTGFTYQVTEFATSGWTLTSIVCTGGTATVSLANRTATIPTLAAGQHITCTFTNTKIYPPCTGYPMQATVFIHGPGQPFGPQIVHICHGGRVKFVNQGSGISHLITPFIPLGSFPAVPVGPFTGASGLTTPFPTPNVNPYQYKISGFMLPGKIYVH